MLVTTETLEENLLATLSAKHELSLAVLDPDSDTTQVDLASGMEELKRRLEVLLGEKPLAPEDESMKAEAQKQAEVSARKEKVATAGGELIGAAFAFIGEIFPDVEDAAREKLDLMAGAFKAKLSERMERGDDGKLNMTITLPSEAYLDTMAKSLPAWWLGGKRWYRLRSIVIACMCQLWAGRVWVFSGG